MNFTTLAKEAHAIAREKGWHDTPRTWGELMALVHSELSEALEAFRECGDVTATWRREDGKIEGVGVELADALIRLADAWEAFGLEASDGATEPFSRAAWTPKDEPFGEAVAGMHARVTDAYDAPRRAPWGTAGRIMVAAWWIWNTATDLGLPIDDLIAEKMEFNRGRAHRHGGKHL